MIKGFKKFISIICSASVLAGSISAGGTTVAAAEDIKPFTNAVPYYNERTADSLLYIEAPDTAAVGDIITARIMIDKAELIGGEVEIYYDNSLLEVQSGQLGEEAKTLSNPIINEKSGENLCYFTFGGVSPVNFSGCLAEISFKVINSGDAEFGISYFSFSADGVTELGMDEMGAIVYISASSETTTEAATQTTVTETTTEYTTEENIVNASIGKITQEGDVINVPVVLSSSTEADNVFLFLNYDKDVFIWGPSKAVDFDTTPVFDGEMLVNYGKGIKGSGTFAILTFWLNDGAASGSYRFDFDESSCFAFSDLGGPRFTVKTSGASFELAVTASSETTSATVESITESTTVTTTDSTTESATETNNERTGDSAIYIEAPNTAAVGDIITAKIMVDKAELIGGEVEMFYNNSLLEVQSGRLGEEGKTLSNSIINERYAENLCYFTFGGVSPVNFSGCLAEFSFKVINSGDAKFGINYSSFSADGVTELGMDKVGAVVYIGGSSETTTTENTTELTTEAVENVRVYIDDVYSDEDTFYLPIFVDTNIPVRSIDLYLEYDHDVFSFINWGDETNVNGETTIDDISHVKIDGMNDGVNYLNGKGYKVVFIMQLRNGAKDGVYSFKILPDSYAVAMDPYKDVTVSFKDSTVTINRGGAIPALELMYGDADGNGQLTAADSSMVLQKVLKGEFVMPIQNLTENYYVYVDVDGNGNLTAADSAMILQKVLNGSYKFPIE